MSKERWGFCLGLYLLPALLGLLAGPGWLMQALWCGQLLGIWRARRRGCYVLESCLVGLATAGVAGLVAAVSRLAGWLCLPCWLLLVWEQSSRRRRRRRSELVPGLI